MVLDKLLRSYKRGLATLTFAPALLWPISASSLSPERFFGGFTVSFSTDSSNLTHAHEEILARHLTRIRAFKLILVIIKSCGDALESSKDEVTQQSLAFARASSVRNFLREAGISDHKFHLEVNPSQLCGVRDETSVPPRFGEVVIEYIGEDCKRDLLVVGRSNP